MPDRPLLIFDGDCSFCRIWIDYWKRLTGEAVAYSESDGPRPSVELLEPGGNVLTGAAAVAATLRYASGGHWLAMLYDHVPGFGPIAELVYRLISGHRWAAWWATRIFFGSHIEPASFYRVAWLFTRLLGFIYLIAFASCGLQLTGLIGEHGILPLSRFLDAVQHGLGVRSFWTVPTLFWLNSTDTALNVVSVAGACVSLGIILGVAQRFCLAAAFLLYLSICSAGQDFVSFQWDMLLLECGFLAIFLIPSLAMVWLYRLILFRLMFLSGAVKLLSQDPVWRNLEALRYHYWTQPLPTPLAWYASQLPPWLQRISTAGVFVVELGLPFLIFFPWRFRRVAAVGFISLQVFILLTGNYTFFNLLTILLCVFLIHDGRAAEYQPVRTGKLRTGLVLVLGALGMFQIFETFNILPAPLEALLQRIAPFGIVNSYGLFAVMTTSRPEIIVQGSNDGVHWIDYQFKFKPGNLTKPPPWVAPYQPRLDWQMWFAALSNWRSNPWFLNFLARLLQGSPEVLNLLASNPFQDHPPRYIQAVVYEYRFSPTHAMGLWWTKEYKGTYLRAISLDDLRTSP